MTTKTGPHAAPRILLYCSYCSTLMEKEEEGEDEQEDEEKDEEEDEEEDEGKDEDQDEDQRWHK